MNCILLLESDLDSDRRAVIKGARAEKLIQQHDLKDSLEITIAVYDRGLGKGIIKIHNKELLEISVSLLKEPPPREEVELIIAFQRPQTVKKILQISASYGIRKIHFIKTENSQKSYMQSKVLSETAIRDQFTLGLQQSLDCIFPQVEFHKQYKDFLYFAEGYLKDSAKQTALKLTADVYCDMPPVRSVLQLRGSKQLVFLALGPESGWSSREREDFLNLGFTLYSLGQRTYRTEIALAMLLGQIALLRQNL